MRFKAGFVGCGLVVTLVSGALAIRSASFDAVAYDPASILGPDECAECHASEVAAWRASAHATSFKDLTTRDETLEMAERLGIERVRTASECVSCHYTSQADHGAQTMRSIAGVSCELCHGAADEWIDIHYDYGLGVTREMESAEHRDQRIRDSIDAGFNHPDQLYDVVRNCFACHLGPNENIVNVGGHSPGSRMELLAWTQGEVRHNFAHGGRENLESSVETRRRMFVLGQCLELAGALQGITGASGKGRYVAAHVARIKQARATLTAISEACDVPQVDQILEILAGVKVSLANKPALSEAATAIDGLAQEFSRDVDGASLDCIDFMLPDASKYVGTPVGG